jgi:hypothetical protein
MSETTPVKLPPKRGTRLNKELRMDFEDFIETVNIQGLNKILRDFIIAYIRLDPDIAEDFFKSDEFNDISMIFHLLDMIERTWAPIEY